MFLLPISIGLAWCLYSALFHPMTEKYYRVWRVKSEESVLSAGHADCFLLAGCSSERGLNGDAAFAGASLASNPDSPEFTYYYHGFLVEEIGEENPTVPSEIYMIDTQEEYAQFFSEYDLSAIYPLDTVDFENECLVYCGLQSAQQFRGWSKRIQSIRVSDAQIELEWDETVNFNAEHEDETVAYQIIGAPDCVVREIFFLKMQRENLPASLRDRYQPRYSEAVS